MRSVSQLGVVSRARPAWRRSCFFSSLDALGLGRERRAAGRDGLAGVVGELARSGQRHVRVAAEREPSDLAGALVAVGEGERLDAFGRDPDAEAGTGGVADGVLGGARLVGPEAGVGELGFHGCRLSVLLLAVLTKMAIHYGTRRDDKTRSRYVRKAYNYRGLLVPHRIRPSHRVSQKYLASLTRLRA